MAKFFLVLTILAAGAAAGLGWVTYQKIGDTKTKLKETLTTLDSTQKTLKQTQFTLEDTKSKLDKATTDLATETAKADNLQTQLSTTTDQLTAATAQVAEETDKYNKEVDLYNAATGNKVAIPGSPTDALMKQIEDLKAQVAEDQQLQKTLTEKAAAAQKLADDLTKKETDRVAKLDQKGMEGMVMAVNQGWNFAVISIGDRQGAVPNAEVLVKRGDVLIAKLKITTVEPATSIADIISDTVAKGQRVLPGDKVIFTGDKVDKPDQ